MNDQDCNCGEPHEQKDTQIKVEETSLQAEVKIPDKPKQVKVLLVQSPNVDRNQPEELAPKDMVEKALATVNTHMTSGGETADHFLTVRNLKAAMDGLRDSQSSIVVEGEQRLQTAVIEEREADRQS